MKSIDGRRVHAPLISFHGLRHTYLTSLYAQGAAAVEVSKVAVSKVAGHANLATTTGMYHMLTPERAAALPNPYPTAATA